MCSRKAYKRVLCCACSQTAWRIRCSKRVCTLEGGGGGVWGLHYSPADMPVLCCCLRLTGIHVLWTKPGLRASAHASTEPGILCLQRMPCVIGAGDRCLHLFAVGFASGCASWGNMCHAAALTHSFPCNMCQSSAPRCAVAPPNACHTQARSQRQRHTAVQPHVGRLSFQRPEPPPGHPTSRRHHCQGLAGARRRNPHTLPCTRCARAHNGARSPLVWPAQPAGRPVICSALNNPPLGQCVTAGPAALPGAACLRGLLLPAPGGAVRCT
jgi:hypothetical protein